MELLIYNRDYEPVSGYNKGDIIEIRPDNYWTRDHDFNRKAFRIVKIPSVAVSNLSKDYYDTYEDKGKFYKRRYKLNITSTDLISTFNSLQDLTIVDKTKAK
jgi:hypothetical protein